MQEDDRLEEIKNRRIEIENEVKRLQKESTALQREEKDLLLSQKESYVTALEKFIHDSSLHYFSYTRDSFSSKTGSRKVKGNMIIFPMKQSDEAVKYIIFYFNGEDAVSANVKSVAIRTIKQSTRHKVKCDIFKNHWKFETKKFPAEIRARVAMLREILSKGPSLESTALVKEVLKPYFEKKMAVKETASKFGL